MTLQEAIEIQRAYIFGHAKNHAAAGRVWAATVAAQFALALPTENPREWLDKARATCGVTVDGTISLRSRHHRRLASVASCVELIADILDGRVS